MRSVLLHKPKPGQIGQTATAGWWIWTWLPALLAVGVIVCESTGTFSSEHTSGWLRPLMERMFGHFQDGNWDEVHHLIRKTGHFLGYGCVCLSFLRAWLRIFARRVDLSARAWRLRSCVLAVLCQATVASLDEIHQTMLPSRTGKLTDVLLDTCGGIFMCLLLTLFWSRRQAAEDLR